MKLKRFKKNENKTLKKVLILNSLCLVVAVISSTTSFAVYQKTDEIPFINAKVRWPKASELTYTTTYNTNIKNVEQALNDLYGRFEK